MVDAVTRAIDGWRSKRSVARPCEFCKQNFKPIEHRGQAKWCSACVPNKQAFGRATRYNINQFMYDSMLANQNNACSICQRSFVDMSSKLIHVDHCHDSGLVRGILCKYCNLGLGWFRTIEIVKRALDYLTIHEHRNS